MKMCCLETGSKFPVTTSSVKVAGERKFYTILF